ncbi:MAG: 1-deoxy-D-xylulose-5-phosphate synthase N-terminal domain-containing protein [Nanobdellota archaeon]
MKKVIPTVFVTQDQIKKDSQAFAKRLGILKKITKNIQIDIMDGKFVSKKSIEVKNIPHLDKNHNYEAHLMIKEPLKEIKKLKQKGFKKIIIHYETIKNLEEAIKTIKQNKLIPTIAFNPETKISNKVLETIYQEKTEILLMGVHPGKERQEFEENTLKKIKNIKNQYSGIHIQADGGVKPSIAKRLAKKGCDAINSGSFIYSNPVKNLEIMRKSINPGLSEKELEKKSRKLRIEVIKMLEKAGSGHTAGPLGLADILTTLYFRILKHNPENPKWTERDYLFLSNGHVCPILYATLAETGYFPKKELQKLRKIDSLLQGHPHNIIRGIENSGGPLAEGLSMAVGVAIVLKREQKPNKVYAICGDGELDEGQCWEAFMLANKENLSNLTIIIDRNKIQLDGNTKQIMPLNNLKNKLESFGLDVSECDGNNIKEFIKTIKKQHKKPKAIIANTIPGKGVSFMENDYHWHGKAPNKEQAEKAIQELKWKA